MRWRESAPHQTFLSVKTNQHKLCNILKGIYGRFRISLNNWELQNFAIFASWSQKSSSGEIDQNFKVFLSIKYYKIRINHIINYLGTSSIHNFVYTTFSICIFENNKSKKKGHLNEMLWLQEEGLVTVLFLFSTK